MPLYEVQVPEVHIAYYIIEANSEEGAINLVSQGYGDLQDVEYSHTLNEEQMSVAIIETNNNTS